MGEEKEMELADFDYTLDRSLIAQRAANPRDSSRLMVIQNGSIAHRRFHELSRLLEKDDVLVLNSTKVMRSRLAGRKKTGAAVELILLGSIGKLTYRARISGGRPRPGDELVFSSMTEARIVSEEGGIFIVRFNCRPESNKDLRLPQPPYIKREVEESEYQTVYSRKEGSLAAPTAGLHFTDEMLSCLERKGVRLARLCLHIGFGTFLPVRDMAGHKMHEEYFEIDRKNSEIINRRKGRLIAVGTTSVRALESCSTEEGIVLPAKGMTGIFIKPGYRFKVGYDALLTNFHLPKSTLLMLVSAFYGRNKILEAYRAAAEMRYRFYSLGDSMIVFREHQGAFKENSQPQ